MKNLSQSTYDRICRKLRDGSDRFPRSLTSIDASDLLLAYESAMKLLGLALVDCYLTDEEHALINAFTMTETGNPRVVLEATDDTETV